MRSPRKGHQLQHRYLRIHTISTFLGSAALVRFYSATQDYARVFFCKPEGSCQVFTTLMYPWYNSCSHTT
jgi:hypothetical protein